MSEILLSYLQALENKLDILKNKKDQYEKRFIQINNILNKTNSKLKKYDKIFSSKKCVSIRILFKIKQINNLENKIYKEKQRINKKENKYYKREIPELKSEIWKQIKNYEDYEVSNFGRVRNKHKRILTPMLNNTGYKQVYLVNGFNNKKFLINRLVAEAFIDLPEELKNSKTLCVGRIDKDQNKNCAYNLKYSTLQDIVKFNLKDLSKKVIVEKDGKVLYRFNSVHEADKFFNVKYLIGGWCRNKHKPRNKELKNLVFRYAKEGE